MQIKSRLGFLSFSLSLSFLVNLAGFLGCFCLLKPKPALSAEKISVLYGPLEFPLTIDALETFANTGRITGGLQLYASFLDEEGLAEFRQVLQQRFQISPVVLSQLTYSPLGEAVLQRLGNVLRTDAGLNGFFALRAATILAAHDPEGLSVIGFLRRYPSHSLRINAQQLLELNRGFTTQLRYRDAAVAAITQDAQAEAANESFVAPANLSDPAELGPYAVSQRQLELNRDRRTLSGETIERRFRVLLYLPEVLQSEAGKPAPVVVISHGLGSSPEAFSYLGKHLASHGFVAVLPQHIGSDESRRTGALTGLFSSVVTPVEFVDRPYDVSFMLDQLEQLAQSDPTLAGRMNLQQVGVIGHSFGGYTALALAGAELNTQDFLRQQCDQSQGRLDISRVLQCTAERLPPYTYALRDARIKATIAISPLTSLVFGPESMGNIQVPTMIVSGSNDFITSAVQEHIHPFLWLNTPEKYLALVIPSNHIFADNTPTDVNDPFSAAGALLTGPEPELGQSYVRELSVAFMQSHLNQQTDYESFLTSTYAKSISQSPLDLRLIRSLAPEQLEQAFGGPPPLPFFPQVASSQTGRARTGHVLQEIAQTGVLRASLRSDSAPFSSVDANGQTTGYCVDLLTAFASQLQEQLNRPVQLEITTQSTLANRFAGVRDGTVQIECGPNTIRNDVKDIVFSTPFFLTGTQFLVRAAESDRINPLGAMADVRIGLMGNTTTETFVQQRYPNAEIIRFPSQASRSDTVQALAQGEIDAMAGDGILLLEGASQRDEYALLPRGPLSCNPYGFALPADDAQWRNAVNSFITSQTVRDLRKQRFTQELSSYLFLTLDLCVQSEQ